jgi:hypothetical protein
MKSHIIVAMWKLHYSPAPSKYGYLSAETTNFFHEYTIKNKTWNIRQNSTAGKSG